MVTIQINKHQYDIPTDWKEVTLRQYIDLATYIDDINHVRVLSIFTGLDYDILANSPCDDFKIKVIPEMDFLNADINVLNIKRADYLTIGGVKYEKILDPSQERLGQKLFMQQIVNNGIENSLPHYSLVAPTIACYYAPVAHAENKWNEKHVKQFEQLVLDMKLVEAYPEANFFLRGYIKYSLQKEKRLS